VLRSTSSRWLAFFAIALLALNLRTAVSSISPVVGFIQQDFSLPVIAIGLLGLAAPLAFAFASTVSTRPARRFGLELTLLLVVVVIIAGNLVRAIAFDPGSLFAGSLLSLCGMGIGNVLLPVVVRRYFPNRIGFISSFYITLTAISATLGSLVAVPVAEAVGWRFSLGQWAIFAALALLPIIPLLRNNQPAEAGDAVPAKIAVWKSPTAIAISGVQGMTAIFGYVSFAWLPLLLIEHNFVSQLAAGNLLALFAIMGLPTSLLVPIIAAKYPSAQAAIVFFSATAGSLGALGIMFIESNLWLWVVLLGLGPTMFPLALTLYNLRSKDQQTVLAVSSFGQGISYSLATIAVLLVGILRELTGGWEAALWLLFAVAVTSSLAGLQLAKKKFVEDEITG
jgi:CP family cyanate transporter-like MFS transporter